MVYTIGRGYIQRVYAIRNRWILFFKTSRRYTSYTTVYPSLHPCYLCCIALSSRFIVRDMALFSILTFYIAPCKSVIDYFHLIFQIFRMFNFAGLIRVWQDSLNWWKLSCLTETMYLKLFNIIVLNEFIFLYISFCTFHD